MNRNGKCMNQKELNMKRFLNYMIALLMIGNVAQTLPMAAGVQGWFGGATMQNIAEGMGNLMDDAARGVQRMVREKREQNERLRAEHEQVLNNPHATQEARARAQAALQKLDNSDDKWDNFALDANKKGFDIAGKLFEAPIDMIKAEQEAAGKLREAAVNAEANKDANIAKHEKTLNWIKEPKNLAVVGGGIAGCVGLTVLLGYGAYKGVGILASMYGNPTLAQETSLLTIGEKFSQFLLGKKLEPKKLSDVIMTPETEVEMNRIDAALKNAVATDDFLFNMLIWGPPGTGKTMMAQRLARSSGLDYVYFSGSSLDQFSLEEALIKLHELFEYPKRTGKKLVIIIDEAERLLGKRHPGMPEKTAKILTDILTYLGTETSDYMAIALSNRPEDLDEAYLSRCDYQLLVGAPDLNQRARIIKKYVTDYLLTTPPATRAPSIVTKMWQMVSKPKPQPRIGVAPDAVNDEMISEIARRTDGFVGRDISKMVFEMRRRARVSPTKTLTKAMVDEVVTRKCNERAQKEAGFKREEVRVKSAATPVVIPAQVKPAREKPAWQSRKAKRATKPATN